MIPAGSPEFKLTVYELTSDENMRPGFCMVKLATVKIRIVKGLVGLNSGRGQINRLVRNRLPFLFTE